MRILKKSLITLAILILVAVILGVVAIRYVKPTETLNLNYSTVPLEDRAVSMAKKLSTTLKLSEADVNNIGKAFIAANPQYGPNVTITGARFQFEDGRVAGHYNLLVLDRVPVGVVVYYRIKWRNPNLVAEVDEAKLRGRKLPNKYFDDIVIPLGDSIPKPLQIENAELSGEQLIVKIKKPTLSELTQLLRQELGL